MKIANIPYGELVSWTKRVKEMHKKGFTKQDWCDLGKEFMQKYNVSERIAVRVLQGNIDEAIRIQEFL